MNLPADVAPVRRRASIESLVATIEDEGIKRPAKLAYLSRPHPTVRPMLPVGTRTLGTFAFVMALDMYLGRSIGTYCGVVQGCEIDIRLDQ